MRRITAALGALAMSAVLGACDDRRPSDETLTPGPEGEVVPSDDVGAPDDTDVEETISSQG